ncbi:hypothetical protein DRQ00_10985 [candidate division KSB1 bacterium]|nr:MAG: hypothetical protein DRQ00_10985 [candidate division KSB1 bacterium]
MRRHFWIVFLLIVVIVLMLFYTVAFTVNFKEIVVVETFGKAMPPIDGATQAGLHWKWPPPIQRITRYDARIFIFDDTYEQIQTYDKQNVLVTVYCGWRVKHADRLIRRGIRNVKDVEPRIRSMVRDIKKQVIGRYPMEQMVNTDPKKMRIPQIENDILQATRKRALDEYGIEIVTIGIKSIGLPQSVSEKVIENMKAERNRIAEMYRGLGQAAADAIISRAQAARDQILEFARAKAKSIRAEGDRAAAEYYKFFRQNQRFAMFLRELDFLKETLKENSVFLLDPSVEHSISFFGKGPSLPPLNAPTTQPAEENKSK